LPFIVRSKYTLTTRSGATVVLTTTIIHHPTAREIIKFKGQEHNGNLVLTGSCAKCGHDVARVVETSQVDSSGN
jgi:hypothetical protein